MQQSNDDERARERLQDLGGAIRRFRGTRTQAELGAVLGLPQTTISRWESGLVDLGVTQIRDIELALGVPFGTLGRAAGYVGDGFVEDDITIVRISIYDDLAEAFGEVAAAAVLELGVRLYDRWGEPDEYGCRSMEWVVVVAIEPPAVDD